MRRSHITILAMSIFLANYAHAQEDLNPEGEIEDVQVIIEKDKPLELPKANRLYDRTEIKSSQKSETSVSEISVNEPKFRSELYNPKFDPKPVQTETKQGNTYSNYVKAGFGNYGSPLLEAYGGLSDRNNNIGAWIRHESFAKGPVRDKASAFSQTQFKLDGDYVARYFRVSPILDYNREGFYYYGYDHGAYLLSSAPSVGIYNQDKSIYQSFSIGANIKTTAKEHWRVNFIPSFSRHGMRFKGDDTFNSDDVLSFKSQSFYRLRDDLVLRMKTESNYATYRSGDDHFKRSTVFFRPGVEKRFGAFQTHLGLGLGLSRDSSTQVYAYPDISVQYDLNDKISILGQLSGDLYTNTLGDLYQRNRFLDDSLTLVNTNVPIKVSGKVNIQVLEQFWVQGFISHEFIKNQILFSHSSQDTSRYTTVIEPKFGKFEIGGKGVYSLYGHTNVSLLIAFYGYDKDVQPVAWFMPHRKFELEIENTVVKKLTASLKLTSLGGIKAPYTNTQNDPALDTQFQKLNPIIDLGVSLKYRIVDQFDAFGSLNNIFNQEYERYTNYPSRGLTAKIGFIFHF